MWAPHVRSLELVHHLQRAGAGATKSMTGVADAGAMCLITGDVVDVVLELLVREQRLSMVMRSRGTRLTVGELCLRDQLHTFGRKGLLETHRNVGHVETIQNTGQGLSWLWRW